MVLPFSCLNGRFKHSITMAKGMVISEKRPRDKDPDISPIKKGKSMTHSKGKEAISSSQS